ncbi:hypothetical protein U8527_13385 [Kordia algicida OT-1]|uniref:Uncharacterized protein n=1 Tax=Kordia algicida OT-1 TaxID=391587 RepID=A9E5P2_9FLAO|nr:hypothetical protein [Kordia algicida]EDP95205.1 hypothetical protein KAOT1_06967 [Kordia algicida OT-1]
MKKKNVKSLDLNKKLVSNFKVTTIVGGTGQSVNQTCTGMQTCTFDSDACMTTDNYSCRGCNHQ